MAQQQFATPIAFIIFNRPDTTQRVFAEIAKLKPAKLLVIADGARQNKPGEDILVKQTRAIIDQVDWPCQIQTNYSDVNLGCKHRVSSGIDWIFSLEPEAIILEDDCLPDPSFFVFCQEMLERYREDTSIGMITGDNFQNGIRRGDGDYYFSKYTHIWGWASWKRAWEKYDVCLTQWPEVKRDRVFWNHLGLHSPEEHYWKNIFQQVYDGFIDTWDYQWTFTCWVNNMVSIVPNRNLISNIGFGANATHTVGISDYANMRTTPMIFPLSYPSSVHIDKEADQYTAKSMFQTPLWVTIIKKMVPLKLIHWAKFKRNIFLK
jgi:hypothetical protein